MRVNADTWKLFFLPIQEQPIAHAFVNTLLKMRFVLSLGEFPPILFIYFF